VVTYAMYGAVSIAGVAVLTVALAVIMDAGGAARALTRRAAEYGSSRGVLFGGEYPSALVRVGAVGLAAIGLTGPANVLQAVGVPFVGGAPFVLYLLMVAGVFFVAGAVRIKSRFRAMIPPVSVPALVGGLMILVLSDAVLAALPAPGQ